VPDEPVVLLSRDQVPAAGAVLARAFHDDPIWTALWPDEARRRVQLVRMFTALTRTTVVGGGDAVTSADRDAVALWMPPGRDLRVMAQVRSGFALPLFMARLSRRERSALFRTLAMFEKRRAALVAGPHWYLQAIGVEPGRHGQGLGTRLVGYGIDRADRDGTPAYLETETEGNVRFYEGLGFSVLETHRAPVLDVPIWLMARRPA
jgi:ribosomal protein S18 acetylase RimI-like enzyme